MQTLAASEDAAAREKGRKKEEEEEIKNDHKAERIHCSS